MNELDEFGKMYIKSVRDHVLRYYVDYHVDHLTDEEAEIIFSAYGAMNSSQWAAAKILLQLITDKHMMTLLLLTNRQDSPWCIVDREKAAQVGLTGITDGLNVRKLVEWISTYSEFKYESKRGSR